ncbi:TBC1D13 [Symbiodinium sp. CCMP2592]|nr:TBC1D13 [Symbiodinium sp. CCMP2592]
MRIICPNCGEEPQKGQRHVCKTDDASLGLEASGDGPVGPLLQRSHVAAKSQRRTVPCATASSMCASIASLASKNPGLWKSSRTLARCGGEDFVAALIFTVAGLPTWSRDPKRTLLAALCGNVAHEAAKALQNFWRQRRRRTVSVYQPRPPKEPANGYSAYRLDKASTHHGSFPTPKAAPKVYFQEGEARRGWAQQSVGSEKNSTAPAPGVAKKSNPRPVQSRAVPVNPLQAMKNRLAQQQQDAEDRRLHGLQQAEDVRLARNGVPETDSRALQGTGPGSWSSHHFEKPEEAWDEVGEKTPAPPALLPAPKEPTMPIIASGQYEPGHSVLATRDLAPAAVEIPDDKEPSAASPPPPAPAALGESMPTPLERRQMRQLAANSSSPSPREAVSEGATPAGSTPTTCLAATERLRDRLKQREGSGRTGERTRSVPDASSMVNWQERIELRHKEAEEQQVHEREEKQRLAPEGLGWQKMDSVPPWKPHTGSIAAPLSDGSMLLIGGQAGRHGGGHFDCFNCTSDVWQFRHQKAEWIDHSKDVPWDPRWGHSVVTQADDTVWLFFGCCEKGKPTVMLRDVWSFNPMKGSAWRKIESPPPFEGIQATSAALTGSDVWFVGGWSQQRGTLSQVVVFNLETLKWTMKSPHGAAPWDSRADHATAISPDGKWLVMFGGQHAKEGGRKWNRCEDTWRVPLPSAKPSEWVRLGNLAAARSSPGVFVLHTGWLMTLGGHWTPETELLTAKGPEDKDGVAKHHEETEFRTYSEFMLQGLGYTGSSRMSWLST